MKLKVYRSINNILALTLSVLLFGAAIAANSAENTGNYQEQLQTIVSSKMPNADSVRGVQQLLTTLGFDPGPIDGVLGAKTRTALKEWQLSTGGKVSDAWLISKSKTGSNLVFNNISDAIHYAAEAILYVKIKSIENQSGLGTIMINSNHPFVVEFEETDYGNVLGTFKIKYKNKEVGFVAPGGYADYEAVSVNNKAGKSAVWTEITPEDKFYIKNGSRLTFSGVVTPFKHKINGEKLHGVECKSGEVKTISSIRKLKFSEKSKCKVTFHASSDTKSLVGKTYQYNNNTWMLIDE